MPLTRILHSLFSMVVTASVSFLFCCILFCLATPSLLPSACQRDQALNRWEVHPPSSAFPVVVGEQCWVARFGLHCRQLKWWFVSIQVQSGFLFSTREGGQTKKNQKTLWDRACFAGPERWNWACHTSSMTHLVLIKNCELPLYL